MRLSKLPSLQPVIVVWHDAQMDLGAEGKTQEVEAAVHTTTCRTIGYLLHKNKREVALVFDTSDNEKNVRWALGIPAKMVLDIIPLQQKVETHAEQNSTN